MAQRKRTTSRAVKSKSGGSFASVLLGLIIGLIIAFIAVYFIMRSPSPILNKQRAAPAQSPTANFNHSRESTGENALITDPNIWFKNDGSIATEAPIPSQPTTLTPLKRLPPITITPNTGIDNISPEIKANVTSKPDILPVDQIGSLINQLPQHHQ